ncbi:hypothetical protein DV737_g5332, partial [Chaetothyriales sp. CBS 132003]
MTCAVVIFVALATFEVVRGIYVATPRDLILDSREAKAIRMIRAGHPDIVLHPVDVLSTNKGDPAWRNSLTKFHAFALTNHTRVLAFDSDSLILDNINFLFLAPNSPVAVPRAYWLTEREDDVVAKQILGSHIMLIEPNIHRYQRIIDQGVRNGDLDMEILNTLFQDSATILPHRRLALLTGEFRNKDHRKYLAPDEDEEWNAMGEVSRAYLVHFSDRPLPKPWKPRTEAQWQMALPACLDDDVETPDRPSCADRFMWTGFYTDYDHDRELYCRALIT